MIHGHYRCTSMCALQNQALQTKQHCCYSISMLCNISKFILQSIPCSKHLKIYYHQGKVIWSVGTIVSYCASYLLLCIAKKETFLECLSPLQYLVKPQNFCILLYIPQFESTSHSPFSLTVCQFQAIVMMPNLQI